MEHPTPPTATLAHCVTPGTTAAHLRYLLDAHHTNAWVGEHNGHTILRLAFNIYNDYSDVDHIAALLHSLDPHPFARHE